MYEIRRIRKLKGLTQVELGKRAGVSAFTIGEIEMGQRDPKTSTLQRLADALDVSVADFYPESPDDEWTIYVKSLTEMQLEQLKGTLEREVERLTTGLTRADLDDVAKIDASMRAIQQLRDVKERLTVVESRLAATA